MKLRVVEVSEERARYQARIAGLEGLASYPIGDDRFQLDHGPDYFAFFDRLGSVVYYAALLGEEVVGVACGILRELAFRPGARPQRTWYICDLKIHPAHRRQRIPLQMLRASFFPNVLRARRGYGISMNPAEGENPVARLASHWRWTPIQVAAQLGLFTFDRDAMLRAAPLIERARGPLHYLSLRGIKDVVLESSGQPMPLLHVQHGPQANAPGGARFQEPQPEHVHMVCAPAGDPLDLALRAEGHLPSSSATIVTHGMQSDWSFVLTSEI